MNDAVDFEALYRSDPDPFSVASSWYERRKEEVLLASLARSHYGFAWDCASGTGHLAQRLASRCDGVLATDAAPTAVTLTSARTRATPHVRCTLSALPAFPAASRAADLTVVSEVLYYLPDAARAEAIHGFAAQSGEIVTVHWRHLPHDAHLSGAAVTDELDAALTHRSWRSVLWHEDVDFVLASWRREGES